MTKSIFEQQEFKITVKGTPFGRAMKDAREAAKISIKKVASEVFNDSVNRIEGIEDGTRVPTLADFVALITMYKADANQLLGTQKKEKRVYRKREKKPIVPPLAVVTAQAASDGRT
jgi:transcriptional regulator with XRE-family HTH domain